MAELSIPTQSCCSSEAQGACCEPSEKSTCCDVSAAEGSCGCSAGHPPSSTAPSEIRETVGERSVA
jgi:hypothetical protein